MKTVLLSYLILISAFISSAQQLNGGFGYGFFGPTFNLTPHLQDELRSPALLGSNLRINSIGIGGGGGGYVLLPIRLLVGGSGFGYSVSDATHRGQVRVNMGGGLVNLGYLVLQKPHLLVFPYLGIGGNSMSLLIKNRTESDTFNLDDTYISPEQEMDLNSGGMLFDMGLALKILAFSLNENNEGGGFMVGIQAGTLMFAGLEDWHDEDTDNLITSMSKAYAFAPYLRITIGGGGFGRKDRHKEKNKN